MVQRYKIGYSTWQGHETAQPVQMPNGEYVTHADYATLLAAHKKLCEAVVLAAQRGEGFAKATQTKEQE